MTNKDQLNNMFTFSNNVDIKFSVSNTETATDALCAEALRWFDAIKNKKTAKSDVMELTYGHKLEI